MKSKNLDVQFFKFLYSCIIVIYHLAASTRIICPGGYYGVEYFLLTSGLFLFLSYDKMADSNKLMPPQQFFAKRFWRFLPWSITAFALTVLVCRLYIDRVTSISEWINLLPSDLLEIIMAKGTGINANQYLINGPAWTISSILIIGTLFWILLYYYRNVFIRIILPFSLLLGFGLWAHLPSANTEGWIGFTTFGTFRTWIIFGLSYYCLLLGKKMSAIPFTRTGKCALTIVELLVHAVALHYIFLHAQRPTQWMLIGLFMVSIAIAISGHSYFAYILNKIPVIDTLGELSFSIYLVHYPVVRIFGHLYNIGEWGYKRLFIIGIAIMIVSLIHYYGTKLLLKGWRAMVGRVKKVCIADT